MKKPFVSAPLLSLITSFLITTSLFSQVPDYVPTDGLVGYWPFNGNANDESGNGNNGTVNGATLTTDRNGNANSAFNFDGISQYIVCNSININSQYTVQAWIRASNSIITSESAANSNSGATYISQGSSNSPCNYADFALGLKSGPYFSGSVNCGNIYYNFEQGNNCTFQMKAQCDPIFTEFDQWISVTYVCANNSLAFFKNGILQWEISGMSNLNNSGFPLSFGCRLVPNSGDNAYGWWKGQIDDIAIYNRALTQEEITALYNGTTNNNIGNNNNSSTTTVPASISYQAVARNAQGTALANTAVQVKFTLITDSLSGSTEYVETHSLSTNSMGLFATAFGTGTPATGTWAGINWTHSNKYLKVELDAGNGFVNLGTQQLLSSPFAIRAQSAAAIENGNLPIFADNAAAIAGGLTVGKLYRTATGDLKVVY